MKNDTDIRQDKKPSHRKYKVAAVLIFLYILCIVSYDFFIPKRAKVDSDTIIRAVAARQLNKDVDKVTDKDLKSITKFVLVDRTMEKYYITGLQIIDINLLRKFSNLRELDTQLRPTCSGSYP